MRDCCTTFNNILQNFFTRFPKVSVYGSVSPESSFTDNQSAITNTATYADEILLKGSTIFVATPGVTVFLLKVRGGRGVSAKQQPLSPLIQLKELATN